MASRLADMEEKLGSELKSTYRKLYEIHRTNQPMEITSSEKIPLFVEGGIEILGNHRSNPDDWNTLRTYRDIITHPKIKSNRVIVQAGPVYGKSLLTLKLAYDWSSEESGSYLKDVKLLILLKYEQLVASLGSIYECIKKFLLPNYLKLDVSSIKEVLSQASSVLLLLDDVEEHSEHGSKINEDIRAIMRQEVFPHFDVILTTRSPDISEKFLLEGKLLRLTGFNALAQDKYIREIVTKDEDDDVRDRIKESLQANPILGNFCSVPFFFVIYAHVSLGNELRGNYTTITGYFRRVISFLHDHFKRKIVESNPTRVDEYKPDNRKLNKIAYDSITIDYGGSWTRDYLISTLGAKFYHHYLRLGIFVEEFTTKVDRLDDNGTRRVRFNHELFCQWFAAHYVADAITSEDSDLELAIDEYLEDLSPPDQLNVYLFVCGIHPTAAKHIIHYIGGMEGCQVFTILCILEQSGDEELVLESVREHCSKLVHLANVDSNLLHRSTLQILAVASLNKITVGSLMLHEAYLSVDVSKNEVILTSGYRLPTQNTLKNLWIEMTGYEWTVDELKNLFLYSVNCESLGSISFSLSVLPRQFMDLSILTRLCENSLQVLWYPALLTFRLNLQTGCWEHTSSGIQVTDSEYEREVSMCRVVNG